MKAVLFCRVSSKEQEETGYSLPAQEKYLRDYADKNGFTDLKVFAVSESAGGKVQRKVFNEMLQYLRTNNISVVIVETTDRMTRNFADVPTIDKWVLEAETHQIHLAKEGCILNKDSKSHEWFMWRVKVATAEYYVRLLSENVKKGQKEKLAQGILPTKPPIGYKTIGEQGHKIHVIDEQKAPLIKKMFDLYASGDYSLKKLTDTMNKEGLTSDKGNKVVKSRLHLLLTDPFYIGKNRWNNELTDGNQETFISKEVFDKVQKLLKSKNTPKYSKHDYRYKGLLRCDECSGIITWEIHKGIIYGHCNHYRNCTQKTWVSQDEIDSQLVDEFEKLEIKNTRIVGWILKALKESHKDEAAYHTSAVNEQYQKQKQLQHRLEKIYEDKLDGKVTEEFYNRKNKEWSDELEKVTEMVKKHNNASNKFRQLGVNIYELSQRAKQIYLKAKKEEDKRSLINLIFTNLTINEGKLRIEYTKTFRLLAEAVKLTNSSKMPENETLEKDIFEPEEKLDISTQIGILQASRPDWLPRVDSNHEPSH